jgi:RHS repeat-associated protein
LFDGSGNVRLRVESDPEGSVHDRFSYDARDRLTGHTVATGGDFDPALFAPASQRLADPIPRRQAAMDAHFGPADPAWIYDAAGNRADHAVNELDQYADLGYDGNGNLTDDGVRQYGYSADDTLVSIVDSRGTTEFYHDPFGRRIAELRPDGGLTQLVWDSTQLIAEYRDGDLHAEYAHEDDIDHPLHLTLAGAHYWYHSDPTGSVRLITDAAGSTAARYDFTPFGEAIRVDGPRNPLRFVARRIDASGTYDFRARQYHPGLGRFLQRDPGGTTDSTNLYAYVDNNPLKYVDPFGAERQNPSTGSAPPSVDSPPPPSTPDAPPAPDATALPDPAAAPSPGDATAPPVPPPSTGHIVKEVAKGVGDFAWETLTGVARLITPPTPEDIIAGRDPLVDAVRGVWGNIRARAVDYGGGASGYAQSLNENLNPLIQGYLSFERARKAYARGDYRAAGKSGAGGVVSVLPVGAQAVKIAGKVAKKALWQKHHVLTGKQNQVSQHPIWQKAGITAEHKINKIDLPVLGLLHPTKSIHRGRHLQRLADKQKYLLDKLEKLGDRLQWSPNEYLRRLSRLLAVERRKLLTGHRGLNKHRRPWAKDEKKYWP